MNDQSQHQSRHHWLGWITLLAFASFLSPINFHIVIAQESPPVVVAPADLGEPPTPPQAPADETPTAVDTPTETPAIAPAEAISSSVEQSKVEPIPAAAPVQTPDAPSTPSEVSSDSEIGKLLPKQEPLVESTQAAKESNKESVRTLSIEPGTRSMLPENRPAWVGAAPDYSSAQHYLYIGSLPTLDRSKADGALDEPLVAAVSNYIDEEIIHQLDAARSMPVTAEFIRKNLIDNAAGYECEFVTGQEPMYQKWVTVRITPEQRELFRQWHTEATQRSRLAPLGVGLVAVLSVISLSHVVLRRFSGASPLTAVNQHSPEQVVMRKTSSSSVWIFFALLLSAVAFAFLIPLFALTTLSGASARPIPIQMGTEIGDLDDLHNDIQIETLDGGHRTIILESKSHR